VQGDLEGYGAEKGWLARSRKMIHEGRKVKSVLRGCEGGIEGVRRNARLRAWINTG
jgi:hypothetical protein